MNNIHPSHIIRNKKPSKAIGRFFENDQEKLNQIKIFDQMSTFFTTVGINYDQWMLFSNQESGLEWNLSTALQRTDDEVHSTCDNISYNLYLRAFDKPVHLLIQHALGSDWSEMNRVDGIMFPTTMEIDYVLVYQNN